MHEQKILDRHITFTNPDYVMYVPKYKDYESDNVHLLVVLFLFFFSLLPGFYQDTKPSWGIVQQAQAAKTSRISPSDRNARKRNT